MNQTRKLIAGGAALLSLAVIATGAVLWDRRGTKADDPAAVAASEVEKARNALPSTTESSAEPTADDIPSAPPQPAPLAANPIYRTGQLPAPRCRQPRQEPTSLANVRAFYTELAGCLNRAWAPAIRKAGFSFQPPKLEIIEGTSASSPCDDKFGTNTYYCGSSATITIDARDDLRAWKESDRRQALIYMMVLFGHEYGHHVQGLTGMLTAWGKWVEPLNSLEVRLQENRRIELQANCLSGVFLGADRDSLPIVDEHVPDLEYVVRGTIDPQRDHGNAENAGNWVMDGFNAADPKACNTFTAAAPFVA